MPGTHYGIVVDQGLWGVLHQAAGDVDLDSARSGDLQVQVGLSASHAGKCGTLGVYM